MNINRYNKIYFIGIGGIAMSAVASIAKQKGFEVIGSDGNKLYSPSKEILEENQIKHFSGYNKKNIENNPSDLYIISAGEDLTNPEVKCVYENKFKHTSFPQFLYELSKDKLRIVIAGTHGKSTTAGLIGHILKEIDNSSFLIGAVFQVERTNFYLGSGHYFIFEGDEYKSEFDDPTPKFQYYKPDILVLTNLEYDHPDLFENFGALEKEFELLIENMPEDGLIIYNADDSNLSKLVHKFNKVTVSFSMENESDFKAEKIDYENDYTSIKVNNKLSKDLTAKLLSETENYKTQLPGSLYAYNALAAISALRALGFEKNEILINLLSYKGLKRRFEIIGKKNGITIIDDYAHHFTAVKATLEAVKTKYPSSKIWCIFEPHTFSRTQATLNELSKAFDSADQVLISQIYPAREKSKNFNVSSEVLVQDIKKRRMKNKDSVKLVNNNCGATKILKSELQYGDVVIVMAVGDFNKLGYELLKVI